MAFVKPDSGSPHVCEGAIVNEWFVVTHANCCPASQVRISLIIGKSKIKAIYHSFIHEQLCLLQFAEPVTFSNFQLQPVCVNANCPEIGSPALYVQQYRSIETHFYRHIVSDGFCEYHTPFKFNENFETCSQNVQVKYKQSIRPEVAGHPLVSFKDGFFLLRGLYTRQNSIFPPAPFDAVGYTATCKDNSWFHHVGFCGYTKFNPPPSWDMKPRTALSSTDPMADKVPFATSIFTTNGQYWSGVIVGPRHVISVAFSGAPLEVAFGLSPTDDPLADFATLPNRIGVATYVTIGDFMLITLQSDFPFFNSDGSLNERVQPICLPTDCDLPKVEPKPGETISMAGIGLSSDNNFLHTEEIEIAPAGTDCSNDFLSTDNLFCAEGEACEDPLGGPVYKKIGGKYFLLSVISDSACSRKLKSTAIE